MAKKTLQLYRGTTAQNNAFTGSVGEVTMDTDTKQLRVHDGFTAGGHIIYKKLDVDTLLTDKADDNTVVHLAGTETVAGDKTFSGSNEFTGLTTFSGTTVFSNTITAQTQATTDNSTKVATTEFVIDVLKAMYPVGSVYIGTQNSCPMTAFFGTWTLVSSGKALWTGNGTNGNSTISAGLPNITGNATLDVGGVRDNSTPSGAFTKGSSFTGYYGGSHTTVHNLGFNAHNSNSIYGNSSTVQPPAYVVNVWRRTA